MKDADFKKPIIAIANSFTQFVPGHVHLKDLGQLVAREDRTGDRVALFVSRYTAIVGSPPGAGLPAKAAGQPTYLLRMYTNPLWEPGLPAMAA